MNHKNSSVSIQSFTPDGNGGGEWTKILDTVGKKPFPANIHNVTFGRFTSDVSEGFYFGGCMGRNSKIYSNPSNSLLTLNFENLTFTNSSNLDLPDSSKHGVVGNGVLLNVPIYGPKGVLLDLGGGNEEFIESFNSINIFDKVENKWYYQIVDGDIPPPRGWFCAVGVHGLDRSSFEM